MIYLHLLYLYNAEQCTGENDPTVMSVGCEADYIHTVQTCNDVVRSPLQADDFGYVKPDLTAGELDEWTELVNEFRGCFAKDLSELGCTPLMTVGINEVANSRPVACRSYKTTPADRVEIAKIVSE